MLRTGVVFKNIVPGSIRTGRKPFENEGKGKDHIEKMLFGLREEHLFL